MTSTTDTVVGAALAVLARVAVSYAIAPRADVQDTAARLASPVAAAAGTR